MASSNFRWANAKRISIMHICNAQIPKFPSMFFSMTFHKIYSAVFLWHQPSGPLYLCDVSVQDWRRAAHRLGADQDDHVPYHRHLPRPHLELFRIGRRRDGGGTFELRPRIAPVLYFSHETMWNWSTVVGPPLPNPDFCHLTAAIGHGSHARRCVWRNWTLGMHSAAAPIPPHRRRVGSNREDATDDPIIRRCQSDL
jgi:hypothetical protein